MSRETIRIFMMFTVLCFITTSIRAQIKRDTFMVQSANKTFVVPAGVTKITIESWGGGGSGGGTSASVLNAGGGGGGGGYNRVVDYPVSSGTYYSITVGAGGSPVRGDHGKDGGASHFASVCFAGGAGKGHKNNGGYGGAGGTGMYRGGDGKFSTSTAISGGGGGSGGTSEDGQPGGNSGGGAAVAGGGKGGGGRVLTGNGLDGSFPGGGGGGGRSGSNSAGGAGADGMVVVSYALNPCATLYWAGAGSTIPSPGSGEIFNDRNNWSVSATSHIPAGVEPGPCNDVVINLALSNSRNTVLMTLLPSTTTIKSLTFHVASTGGNSNVYEGRIDVANQTLHITGNTSLSSHNGVTGKTTQVSINTKQVNSKIIYGGDLTTNSTKSGSTGESFVYPFSNPVGIQNQGTFVLMGNATLAGVGDDANPELNKPAKLVFDGAGTQLIQNNNANGFPIYLGFNTVIGEANSPRVTLGGTSGLGFRSIQNVTIQNNSILELESNQSLNRITAGTPGTFTMSGTSRLILKAANYFPTGYNTAYNLQTGSTVEFSSAAGFNQTIPNIAYANLELTNSSNSGSSVKSLAANTAIKSNLKVNSFVLFNQATFSTTRSPTGGTFTLADNAVHELSAAYPGGFSSYSNHSNSTTHYKGSAAQTISPQTYGHLRLSGAGTKTAGGNTVVQGHLTIESTAKLMAQNYTCTVHGNWTQNGNFDAGTGIVSLAGFGNSLIDGGSNAAFNQLTIAKSSTATTVTNAAAARVFSTKSLTVTRGNLILEAMDNNYNISGNLIISPDGTLTHSVSWDGTSRAIYLFGNLDVTGVFQPTVRSHLGMRGTGSKTIRTGSHPSSTLSILTLSDGNYTANGPIQTNQETWTMFQTPGTLSTNGQEVSVATLLCAGGTLNVNGGLLKVLQNAEIGYYGHSTLLAITNGTVSVGGKVTIHTNGNLQTTGSPEIEVGADLINQSNFTAGNGKLKMNGSGAQRILSATPLTFHNIEISGIGTTLHTTVAVTGDILINSGYLDLQNYSCNRAIPGGTLTLKPDSRLLLAGTEGGTSGSNFPANFASYSLEDGSTVDYFAAANQTIFAGASYSNLTLSGSGQKSANAGLTVRGNLQLQNSAVLNGGNGTHMVGGNWINNASENAFQYATSVVELNGTALQQIGGTFGSSFFGLTIKNSAGISLSQPVSVYAALRAAGSGSVLATNDLLTLKATPERTAIVGNLTSHTITGKVRVERYEPARKAWRLLAAPVMGTQTIKESWQEGAVDEFSNPLPGHGIQITSSAANWAAAGFDRKSAAPSVKYFDRNTQSWTGIPNTIATAVNDVRGYMVFIRGDRLATSMSSLPSPTQLRSFGELKTGTQPSVAVLPGKYETLGNPYASPIDFTKLSRGTAVQDVFYVWDPMLTGEYGLGGYQVYAAVNGWHALPGGTTMHPSGIPNTTINAGEAFFVRGIPGAAAADLNITISEDAKAGEGRVGERNPDDRLLQRQFLRTSLHNAAGQVLDGHAAVFHPAYQNTIDQHDVVKLASGTENVSLLRGSISLAVEARSAIGISDTLFFKTSGLSKQTYQLSFAPSFFESEIKATLFDRFLNTTTDISMSDTTWHKFTVTSDAKSSATNRFYITLASKQSVLAAVFGRISAKATGETVQVTWNMYDQQNVDHFVVERSVAGKAFEPVGSLPGTPGTTDYEFLDQAPHDGVAYYRVRGVGHAGENWLSAVAKVTLHSTSFVRVQNPTKGGVIRIEFNGYSGQQKLSLYNTLGQLVQTSQVVLGAGRETINFNAGKLPAGVYSLTITTDSGTSKTFSIRL